MSPALSVAVAALLAAAAQEHHTHVGDMNCDGAIDFADVNPFVDALANPGKFLFDRCREHGYAGGYDCAYRGLDYIFAADLNLDGKVDFDDIKPFVDVIMGADPPNYVPRIKWRAAQ